MCSWINWGEIETAEMDKYDAFYIISFISIFVFLTLALIDTHNRWSHLSLAIGLIGVLIAVCSIQFSTKQLTEMEVDYWNARGIDDNRKGAEHLKQRENYMAILTYKNAIDAFDKAEKLDPLYAKSWSNRGNALRAHKKYDEAIEAFRRAIELDSQSPKTWANYGNALYERGIVYKNRNEFLNALSHHEKAIDAFNIAIEQDRTLSLAWNGKGAALKDKGDIFKSQSVDKEFEHFKVYANNMYDGAIRCYNEAIELDQNFGLFWHNKGVALDAKGDYNGAIQAYDMALKLEPKNAEIWRGKGDALKSQKGYGAAIHSYNKAIEFDPQNLAAWNQRGNALVEQAHALTRANVGRIWSNTSDAVFLQLNYYYREALKSYSMSIDINPLDGMAWDNKGNVLTYMGEFGEAIQAHDKAIMLEPQYALAQGNKGFTLFCEGKYDEAIKCYDEAIKLNPNFAKFWKNKGDALKALGRTKEADAAFTKAKELGYTDRY
jgi:tetratricopeptide (TPR) repeat protein